MINLILVALFLLALLTPNLGDNSAKNHKDVKKYLRTEAKFVQWPSFLKQLVGPHRMLDLLTKFMNTEKDSQTDGEFTANKRKNKKNKSNANEPVDTEDFDAVDAGGEGKKKRKRKRKSQVCFFDCFESICSNQMDLTIGGRIS